MEVRKTDKLDNIMSNLQILKSKLVGIIGLEIILIQDNNIADSLKILKVASNTCLSYIDEILSFLKAGKIIESKNKLLGSIDEIKRKIVGIIGMEIIMESESENVDDILKLKEYSVSSLDLIEDISKQVSMYYELNEDREFFINNKDDSLVEPLSLYNQYMLRRVARGIPEE